jgi:citrate synthase
MGKKAELHYDGKVYEIPVVTGTENENALDISKLRGQSGLRIQVLLRAQLLS